MDGAKTSMIVSPELLKVAERARRDPKQRLLALAQYIDVLALTRAFGRLRKKAAVGVDGVTVEAYGEKLADNLEHLHRRMKGGQYRHQSIRRVHIPKDNGKTRPIGISTVEDKVVQGAVREVLEAVYEQEFLECSHGFRPKRSAHDAIKSLNAEVHRGAVRYVLEADIQSFFDSIDRKMLMDMLRERIADESLMRLVGKCLHVGVLDGETYSEPDEGTTQGSGLSPLLGNVYLHNVLDVWFEHTVKPRLRGEAHLIRFADDFIITFVDEGDARRVEEVLHLRMAKYNLTLHPEKTRLIHFRPPDDGQGKGSGTFDFLGFTMYWQRTRRGGWRMGCKTRRGRLQRAVARAAEWCRRHRTLPIGDQCTALTRKLVGHYNYFGVNGNLPSLARLRWLVVKTWRKWLERRSQRGRMSWQRFNLLLGRYPLPQPQILVSIWS